MKKLFKTFSAKLPVSVQQELKRLHFRRQIARGRFNTTEIEYELLDRWVSSGDWVIDVGANIGHYTHKLSKLVGANGRVIALEPVPHTFELLAANVALLPITNTTLINAAASDAISMVGMDIPYFGTGLKNYYEAHISDSPTSLKVLCIPIDSLELPGPVTLVKVDAEGHDFQVIRGMRRLLERDRPVLIIEEHSSEIREYLDDIGYDQKQISHSHNAVFQPR